MSPRILTGMLVVMLSLGAGCVHGSIEAPRICKSSTLRYNEALGVVTSGVDARVSTSALSEASQTLSQDITLDLRSLLSDFDAEVTPLDLTLSTLSGLDDFQGVDEIVISIRPLVDAPARPALVIADHAPTAPERSGATLTMPLSLGNDDLHRYAGDNEVRLTVQLTGALPTSAFSMGESACFRARGTF
jgi:hypothetical protein